VCDKTSVGVVERRGERECKKEEGKEKSVTVTLLIREAKFRNAVSPTLFNWGFWVSLGLSVLFLCACWGKKLMDL
jgi:hypothetical protein